MLTTARIKQCERLASSETTQMIKEKEAEAECQKKFRAPPVPSHVNKPLYQEMNTLKEKERKQGREQRRDFLLSIQKPFSFHEREKEKREKFLAMIKHDSNNQKNNDAPVQKPHHKDVKDSAESEVKGGFPLLMG